MSLAIDIDKVTGVLLGDGLWHDVAFVEEDGATFSSFYLDSYEFVRSGTEDPDFSGGQDELVAATGFSFKEADGSWLSGPLTAILAVRSR